MERNSGWAEQNRTEFKKEEEKLRDF